MSCAGDYGDLRSDSCRPSPWFRRCSRRSSKCSRRECGPVNRRGKHCGPGAHRDPRVSVAYRDAAPIMLKETVRRLSSHNSCSAIAGSCLPPSLKLRRDVRAPAKPWRSRLAGRSVGCDRHVRLLWQKIALHIALLGGSVGRASTLAAASASCMVPNANSGQNQRRLRIAAK